jgi:hypothetical protein
MLSTRSMDKAWGADIRTPWNGSARVSTLVPYEEERHELDVKTLAGHCRSHATHQHKCRISCKSQDAAGDLLFTRACEWSSTSNSAEGKFEDLEI